MTIGFVIVAFECCFLLFEEEDKMLSTRSSKVVCLWILSSIRTSGRFGYVTRKSTKANDTHLI